jgi:SagB-type dehydrogenase family enzyme
MKPIDEGFAIEHTKVTGFLGWGDAGRPSDDDPAETFHEASKLVPSVPAGSTAAAQMLENDPATQALITRSAKRHPARPAVALPPPQPPAASLGDLIGARRSRRSFGSEPVSLEDLSTLLHVAYGIAGEGAGARPETLHLRSVPSGGALYPLETYPVVRRIDGIEAGLYHYDPLRHALDRAGDIEPTAALEDTIIRLPGLPDLAGSCAVAFFVAGIFWRTRFKYGQRGYRWVLIEAGHVGQNLMLAAESLGLAALPYGGFWDRKVDSLLGLDGVNESVVYTLLAGSRPEADEPPSSDEANSFS